MLHLVLLYTILYYAVPFDVLYRSTLFIICKIVCKIMCKIMKEKKDFEDSPGVTGGPLGHGGRCLWLYNQRPPLPSRCLYGVPQVCSPTDLDDLDHHQKNKKRLHFRL